MFVISLDVADREAINEIANRDFIVNELRDALMTADSACYNNWMSDHCHQFPISQLNLERYLAAIHNVYITKA